MKLGLLCFALSIFFASNVFSGQVIVCDEPIKDFGIIEENKKVSHTFVIKNISNDVIEVDKVASSCGCIITSKKEFKLDPNQSTDINVEFNSTGTGGMKIWKTIAVCPKDDKNKQLILTVKADVKGIPPEKRITLAPTQATLDGGPDKKYTFRLQIPSDPKIKFSVEAPQWLSYSLQKSKFNDFAAVVNWDVEICLKTKQREKLSGNLVISSNLPQFEKVSALIQVVPMPKLIINPYMIRFEGNDPDQSKEVMIKYNEGTLESIRDLLEIKSSKKCVETSWIVDGDTIHLKVVNKACSPGLIKIEIRAGDELLGVIPVLFKENDR